MLRFVEGGDRLAISRKNKQLLHATQFMGTAPLHGLWPSTAVGMTSLVDLRHPAAQKPLQC